jgi:glycosyltransferase involved in cell wall biosynthesis
MARPVGAIPMRAEAPARPRVSAVLITLNAQAHLGECLASLAWCDEIVVVDGGSTDETLALCAAAGARVSSETEWRGFGVQKNLALDRAGGDWLFSIDADEVCTPALRGEIEAAIATGGDIAALEMPRRSSFCGHWMRHGGWWPDRVVRVFARGKVRFSEDLVHERPLVQGNVARLRQPLLHYTYDTLEQALAKLDRYSTLGARQAYERGKRATPASAVLRGAWAFFRTYVLRLGLLDGWAGLMLALYNGQGTYYRYLKLWLLDRNR